MDAHFLLAAVHDKDRRALEALIGVYGDDVNSVLNGLHSIAARIAIAGGVKPKDFSAAVKHHWDFIAKEINRSVQ